MTWIGHNSLKSACKMDSLDLREICRQYSVLPAIISAEGSVSYEDLARLIAATLRNISNAGITAGETVAVLSEHNIEQVIFLLALIQSGAIAIPLNTRFPASAIRKTLSDLQCKQLFVSSAFGKYPATGSLRVRKISSVLGREIADDTGCLEAIPFTRRSNIILTSGSRGVPKAAVHYMGNHYYSALGSAENIEAGTGDRWMLTLPLFHVGGLAIIFRCLLAGASIVIPDDKLPIENNAQKYHITHLSLVGTQFYRIMQDVNSFKKINRLHAILLGGGAIDRKMIKKAFINGLPVFVSYGLTEMSSQVTTTRRNDKLEKLYTAGKLLPFRELRIAADNEILVRGPTLFAGYYLQGEIHRSLKDGWFATGDLAALDEEGFLNVLGRKDNMFISGGENIHPEEIEQALMDIPAVESAVVVDVPDIEYGARPCAFIQAREKLDISDIRSFLSERIQRYKIPSYYFFEHVETGELKAQRMKLRQKALSRLRIQSDPVV